MTATDTDTLIALAREGRIAVVPVEATPDMQRAYFGEIDRNMARVENDLHFGRFSNHSLAYGKMLSASPTLTPALLALAEERDRLREALRNIAEGNLGDAPWQAGYARIKEIALRALSAKDETP